MAVCEVLNSSSYLQRERDLNVFNYQVFLRLDLCVGSVTDSPASLNFRKKLDDCAPLRNLIFSQHTKHGTEDIKLVDRATSNTVK
jgi:hypothetical protein